MALWSQNIRNINFIYSIVVTLRAKEEAKAASFKVLSEICTSFITTTFKTPA